MSQKQEQASQYVIDLLSICMYHSDEFLRQLPEITLFLEHYEITVNYHHMNCTDIKTKNQLIFFQR